MRPIRVLHCPTMVGGNPQGLAQAERSVGLDSRSIALDRTYVDYPCDEILWNKEDGYVKRELKRWKRLMQIVEDFDIIHFNFGRSLMPHRAAEKSTKKHIGNIFLRRIYDIYASIFELNDLSLLKRAGKGIVVTYQGSDARPNGSSVENEQKRRRITKFARHADRIYALNPDLLRFLPEGTSFMPYAHIDLDEWKPVEGSRSVPARPVVVHAPTDRAVKGTSYIVDAVSRLKAEGVDFEFVLVENMSHGEAKKTYEKSDLLVDQLLIGWYGGIAVEFMALGKPVISYIRDDDLAFIPDDMRKDLPIINATPSTIYAVLKEWLTVRRTELAHRGMHGRRYVETWHNPVKIAGDLKKDYEDILRGKK